MKINKSPLLVRYALYSFIIFFIPFFVFGINTYRSSTGAVKEGVQNIIVSELSQVQRQMEEHLGSLDHIAARMSVNQSLSYFMLTHSFHGIAGVDLLGSYIAGQDAVPDVILHYFVDEDRFFTNRGSFSFDVLHNHFFLGVEMTDVQNLFRMSEPGLVKFPQGDSGFSLQYVVPITDSQGIQYGSVAFLFDRRALKRILPLQSENHQNHILVLNAEGELILSNDPTFMTGDWELEDYPRTELASDRGLTFISISDSSYLTPFLNEARMLTFRMLLGVFVFGLTAVVIFSYMQYLPIKKLHSSLEDENSQGGNELEQIHQKIHHMAERTKVLQQINNAQNILEIIEHADGKETPFTSTLKQRAYSFCIALIKHEHLTADLKPLFPLTFPGTEAHLFQIPLQRKSGILLVQTSEQSELAEAILELKALIDPEGDLSLFYGRRYEALDMIRHSYLEALIACDSHFGGETSGIVPYEVREVVNDSFPPYPNEMAAKLFHSIKQGSLDIALESLEVICTFMKENQRFVDELQVYRHYIVQNLAVTAAAIGLSKEEFGMKALLENKELQSFKQRLTALIQKMTEKVQQNKENLNQRSQLEVFHAMEKRFMSPDLSLESLAEEFNYSVTQLMKMIREQTGLTFAKHIQELRLEHIKKQLIETDLPIKDIIMQTGYYDVSNFTRTFKKKVGLTPGQYRELNK